MSSGLSAPTRLYIRNGAPYLIFVDWTDSSSGETGFERSLEQHARQQHGKANPCQHSLDREGYSAYFGRTQPWEAVQQGRENREGANHSR